ncbi:ATP-binding protein [Anaeromyxobacter sp. Fw109-5]|uniref:hybrid sensor histidine kinase/response regulator n=1 Tax=Anaeromyxobacter sp. (strain Fw109-5) TaxID=404589 RepID=UPI0000ED763A|nr:ATP-binding protein [Anaeromyxobacter sp. Fw109-5]ABS25875.1 histidine kinase [Anaeromyxobacter sp. Fw109-5]
MRATSTMSAPAHWPRRPIALRRLLVALALGSLLPIGGFAAIVVWRLTGEERASIERRLIHAARLLAGDVDREMIATFRTLRALAESDRLDAGALGAFDGDARRVLATQPSWRAVLLSTPDGVHLLNTLHPPGAEPEHTFDRASLARVVETRAPAVGDLARRPEGWSVALRVPVIRDGQVKYVLTALMSPAAFADLAGRAQRPEEEWTRVITDSAGVVVARTRDPERFVGVSATATYQERTRGAAEGVYRDTTLDGAEVYLAFARAAVSGWTAGIAVPSHLIEGPTRHSSLAIMAAGLALLVLSVGGAIVMSRRLSAGIALAATAAETLARGGRPRPAPSRVAELERLGEALERSAALLRSREAERDEHLARAEAARAQAETASRTKDEFLAMLGHELRNPLSPIVTALQLIKLRGDGQPREYSIIERQVSHMSRLVEDLLDVSRITRGKIVLQPELLELSSVVAKALEMAGPLLEARAHRLAVDVPAEGLPVRGDPVRLAQIVANLLTNAAKYTPPGGHVEVWAGRHGAEISLTVSDDGQGLSPELLPRLFDLFVQGPRAPDRHEGGLGLGLAVVKSLVTAHGGTVEAQSAGLGRGSTFTVRLPAAAAEAAPPALGPRPGALRRAARPLRVLVVDDNADAAELLAAVLSAAGHAVRAAHDGVGALAALDQFTPEVAVLDIGLPVMDGHELAARIRDRMGAAPPAFIALTGYGQATDLARSRAAGFEHHLVKPVDADALLAVLEALAADRSAPRAS